MTGAEFFLQTGFHILTERRDVKGLILFFIDPPYARSLLIKAWQISFTRILCSADNAIVICETCDKQPVEHNGLVLRRHNRYGKTYISLYVVENGKSDIVMA